ncbi:MAG: ribosome small subunit-dependent GTPase A [Bacillota bacterium]
MNTEGNRLAQGVILKGVGGFYTVLLEGGKRVTCKARGRFRNDGETPLPGDCVLIDEGAGGEGSRIAEIHPRKNLLARPAIANVDQLVVVLALSAPKPDLLLLDKLLIAAENTGIAPVLLLNKLDEADEALKANIAMQYLPTGYPVLAVSTINGRGLEEFCGLLKNKVSCLAGQSAVGKTSLLNRLIPDADLPVGVLSKRTDRGRHTTRHAELIELPSGGVIADTPGFSMLDPIELEPNALCKLYPEMRKALGRCRFARCLHKDEPDCAVKELIGSGSLSRERYERYVAILNILVEKRKHQYD